MFDPYDFFRKEACSVLKDSVQCPALSRHINCCSQGFNLATPLPLMLGEDADAWAKRIKPSPYFETVTAQNGNILFQLSDKAYKISTEKILMQMHALPPLESAECAVEYAYMRMRMYLEKNSDDSVYSQKSVQRALWAAFALVSSGKKSVLENACTQALLIGDELCAKERFMLKENCASVGTCIALLLYGRLF